MGLHQSSSACQVQKQQGVEFFNQLKQQNHTRRQGILNGLCELKVAAQYAVSLRQDFEMFAVPKKLLTSLGLKDHDLKYLCMKGVVREISPNSGVCIVGQNSPLAAKESRDTKFYLTENWQGILAEIDLEVVDGSHDKKTEDCKNSEVQLTEAQPVTPCWNSDCQELRYGSVLVKRFRTNARNQFTVLQALEEERWPRKIFDPLPPSEDVDSKRRLHDTIKALNGHQVSNLLRFRGDGSGQGIVWSVENKQAFGKAYSFRCG